MKFHLKSNIIFDQVGQFRCLATTAGEETLCLPLWGSALSIQKHFIKATNYGNGIILGRDHF